MRRATCRRPLYSYSFEPNPAWPHRYSGQDEILDYIRRTAAKYGVDRFIRYGTEVTSADFDAHRGKWQIHTSDGDLIETDLLVPAVGQLSRPSWPNIPGMDTFTGTAFHSAQWDHSYDLTGKRVAVIGTGASAIQFVPKIAPDVAALTIYQRTPPYIWPKFDTEYGSREKFLRKHVPATRLPGRLGLWLFGEWATRGMIKSKSIAKIVEIGRAGQAQARDHRPGPAGQAHA